MPAQYMVSLVSRYCAELLAAAAAMLAICAGTAHAATLVADYQFNGTNASSVPGAPDIANLGAGNTFTVENVGLTPTPVLQFPDGGGLSLATGGLIPQGDYSVVVKFRLADIEDNEYKRILEFKSGASDNGLYEWNGENNIADPLDGDGALDYYDGSDHFGIGSPIAPDAFIGVALIRNAAKQITVYANGAHQVSYNDVSDTALLATNELRFFKDNSSSDEESAGAVARIRVYSGALTTQEVADIFAPPPPAPPPPAPAPPAPVVVADASAPSARLSGRRRQNIVRQKGSIFVYARSSELAIVTAKAKVRVPGASRTLRFRRVRDALLPRTRTRLRLRLSRRSFRVLRRTLRKRKRRLTATVRLTFEDAAGNTSSARRRIRLTG